MLLLVLRDVFMVTCGNSYFRQFLPLIDECARLFIDDCATTRCKHYAICEGDETTGTQCVCPRQCVHVSRSTEGFCGGRQTRAHDDCDLKKKIIIFFKYMPFYYQ